MLRPQIPMQIPPFMHRLESIYHLFAHFQDKRQLKFPLLLDQHEIKRLTQHIHHTIVELPLRPVLVNKRKPQICNSLVPLKLLHQLDLIEDLRLTDRFLLQFDQDLSLILMMPCPEHLIEWSYRQLVTQFIFPSQ